VSPSLPKWGADDRRALDKATAKSIRRGLEEAAFKVECPVHHRPCAIVTRGNAPSKVTWSLQSACCEEMVRVLKVALPEAYRSTTRRPTPAATQRELFGDMGEGSAASGGLVEGHPPGVS
jgi:hypothetical protein